MTELRILYDGPALSGRTSSMSQVHQRLAGASTMARRVGDPDSGAIEFTLGNADVQLVVSGVVGAVWRPEFLRTFRDRADAIILMFDSQVERMEANEACCESLEEFFATRGRVVPVVVQFNKRDLPNAVSVRALKATNRFDAFEFSTVAPRGQNVFPPFECAVMLAARARDLAPAVRNLLATAMRAI